ncbi:MAG: flagellar M-ring protein FliF [Hyphomicrobiaceae bacterium]|nr:flagellar M-ring protein FliF [Hyphomicrobiaceae bacterium]
MGAVAAGLIGFFIYLMMQLSAPQMSVLYSDLEFEDRLGVIKKLEGLNIPYEVRQDGAVVLAPKERILRLRMDLAAEGLPAGGSVGYEIFDKTGSLGTTSFVQNINHIRALEGELSRTIRSLKRITRARVHLVIPKKKIFSREKRMPTASIIVKTRGRIESSEIAAIQHLVASAIEGLKPSHVSIVDATGRLLASGSDNDTAMVNAKSDERTAAIENRMRQKIEEIVSAVVGQNRARIKVAAELNFNQITQTSDIFDPDQRVLRSSQTREESSNSARASGNGAVSVGAELPGADAAAGAGGNKDKEASKKTEEINNWEISRTTKTEVFQGGRIKRLSVAVLVDGIYNAGPDGKPVYTERTQKQLDKINALVKSAMGFDKIRGDQLHVVNLRFADTGAPAELPEEPAGFFDLAKADYFHIAELAILFLISTLVLLFVVRPLVRRIVTPEEAPAEEQILISTDANGKRILVNADGQPLLDDEEQLALEDKDSATSGTIKNARIAGEIQASAVAEIGAIIESSPTDSVAVIRQWIEEDADDLNKVEAA